MKNPHTYIALPTDKASRIVLEETTKTLMLYDTERTVLPSNGFTQHHLYILSGEEIKGGDWYYNGIGIMQSANGEIEKGDYINCKKIIATTNPELHFEKSSGLKTLHPNIPSISQSDIEYIISLYNGKMESINKPKVDSDKIGRDILRRRGALHTLGEPIFQREVRFYTEESVLAALREALGNTQCLQNNADKRFTLDYWDKLEKEYEGYMDEVSGDTTYTGLFIWLKEKFKEQPAGNRDTVMVEYDGNIHDEVYRGVKPKLQDGCIVISRD